MFKRFYVFLVSLVIAISFGLMVPANAITSPGGSHNSEILAEKLLEYAVLDSAGNIDYFDVDGARADDVSEVVLLSAISYNQGVSNRLGGGAFPALAGHDPQIGFPVHGNWCGPGVSGPGAPIDLLDTRCRTHDLCYAEKGYFNKTCDRQLVALITVDLQMNKYSGWVKAKAIAIRQVFAPNAIL